MNDQFRKRVLVEEKGGINGNRWRRIADETIFSDSRDFSVWRVSKLIFSAQSKKRFLHDERGAGSWPEMEMGKLHGVNDSQPLVWSPFATFPPPPLSYSWLNEL